MDALSMAAGASRVSDRLAVDEQELRPAGRIQAALAVLSEAYVYALDLDSNPWDFAIEIPNLRRFNLTNSDLRWLVGRGYVEFGVEVTTPSQAVRTFRRPSRLMFSKRSCFVLTSLGAAWFQELSRQGEPPAGATGVTSAEDLPSLTIAVPSLPTWDRNRQELRVGTTIVRRFKIPSVPEETVLAAFEEFSWPAYIDDPLPSLEKSSSKWRLQRTIEALNHQQRPPLIRFSCDGTARGVLWEYVSQEHVAHDL